MEANLAAEFSYKPLSSKDHIRVLELHPGHGVEVLNCTLREQDIQEKEYEAISYVWGNPTKNVTIICNGRGLKITRSLSEALTAFRLTNASRQLWADDICINQGDNDERKYQVALMGSVYKSSRTVLGWTGV